MALNRTLWKNPFNADKIPDWKCPTCLIGILKAERKDFNIQRDKESIENQSHPDWEPYWISGVFSGMLKCNNKKCQENVSVVGNMYVHEEQYYVEAYDDVDYGYIEVLSPKLFIPTLEIFPILEDVPQKLKNEILDTFSLFFVDNSASANKIRNVVEIILDEFKVKKITTDKEGKRKKISTHHRIELFQKTKFKIEADLLMAIKWLGNVGSHNDALTQDDILDGLEILEHVLNKLYEKESKRIATLSKTINKRKGPIKR